MKPQPHPEVVNRHPSMLIVGYGHVGQQMGKWFPGADYVDVEGVPRRVSDGEPTVQPVYELGFLCVPTPPDDDGHCDTSIVRAAYATWDARVRYWCLKSTVSVGTTESLGQNVCMSPELYGETTGHPISEGTMQAPIILGGPKETTAAFAEAWSLVVNSYARIYQTDSRTAELMKYMENCWIGTKVTFCNEFYGLARAAGVDWHTLRELWLSDPRVSRSHTFVYPRNRGWGGKCIPKDTAALVAWAASIGHPARLMEQVREINKAHRALNG